MMFLLPVAIFLILAILIERRAYARGAADERARREQEERAAIEIAKLDREHRERRAAEFAQGLEERAEARRKRNSDPALLALLAERARERGYD